jgi:DNA-binding transcriptional MocR family regulator
MPKHSTFQLYNPNHENDLPLPLYRRLANHYLSAMKAGTLVVGDRMPSVRKLMQLHTVSLSTALQMCRQLETEGWLEARPRSGYFVRQPRRINLVPATEPPINAPIDPAQFVGIHERVSAIIAQGRRPVNINFARANGEPDMYPQEELKIWPYACCDSGRNC